MTTESTPTLEHPVVVITSEEFEWITAFLRLCTGIELKPGKESLVMGRLDRRLAHYGLASYSDYFRLLGQRGDPDETRIAIDLMTTNETYFFREPQHFELLRTLVPSSLADRPFRVWSAASSTGEEAYSAALTLASCLPVSQIEVVGTDVSTRVLQVARRGLYPLDAAHQIPEELRRTYCLKGSGDFAGTFTLRNSLRSRVSFSRANLVRTLPNLGIFDVVFLRNVMIYFNAETKQKVIQQITSSMRVGAHLLIGHAETLSGLDTGLQLIQPSVYQLVGP